MFYAAILLVCFLPDALPDAAVQPTASKPGVVLKVPVTAIVKPAKVAVKATEETVEWVSECAGGVCRMVPKVVKKTEAVLPPLPPRPRRWLIRPFR